MAAAKAKGKKRVRRIQIELPFYRQQVQALELKLKRLKLQKHVTSSLQQRPEDPRGISSLVDAASVSTWNAIAERQFKERLRAETKQTELKAAHVELAQLLPELLKLLEKCRSQEKEMVERSQGEAQQKFWVLSADSEDLVFSEQLTKVAKLQNQIRLQQYQTPGKALKVDWGLSRGNMVMKRDLRVDNGVILEMHCGTTVPFNLAVAARAYWRFFCLEHGETLWNDSTVNLTTDTIARSFSFRLEIEDILSDASGKFTCRIEVNHDEVIIVWVEHVNVSEFAGIKFSGMQYQKRAYMRLRRVPHEGHGQPSTSTVVETHYETVPKFHVSVSDQWKQTLTFINCAYRTHAKLNKLVCQTMESLLLEEDWKETFGERCEL